MPRDYFIAETPFFGEEHARLAAGVADFAAREVAPRAGGEEQADADAHFRELLALLAEADLLRYAVAREGSRLDARSLCLVREALAYHSATADLAFAMQGLGTYALSLAAPEHVRDFWLDRAHPAERKAKHKRRPSDGE